MRHLIFLCLMLAGLALSPARAELDPRAMSALGFRNPAGAEQQAVLELQADLAWIGHYRGALDGVAGEALRRAERDYLRSIRRGAAGRMDRTDRSDLRMIVAGLEREAGFQQVNSDWAGVSMEIPTAFLQSPELAGPDRLDVVLGERNGLGLSLRMLRGHENGRVGRIADSLAAIWQDEKDYSLLRSEAAGELHVVVLIAGKRRISYVIGRNDHEWRAVEISVSAPEVAAAAPILRRMFASLNLMSAQGVAPGEVYTRLVRGDFPGASDRPDWYRTVIGNGSGSIVGFRGEILTNHHVVSTCARLTVNGNEAILIATDPRVDLALVRSERFANRTPVRFRSASANLGEPIHAMGYPVFDMSPMVNLTAGVVSSSVGYKGSRDHIQVTAPIQPGNSGGPVFDLDGAQVAVAVAKLDSVNQIVRNVENMAYAIRAQEAIDFLERFGTRPQVAENRLTTADGSLSSRDREALFERMREQTVRVECHGE